MISAPSELYHIGVVESSLKIIIFLVTLLFAVVVSSEVLLFLNVGSKLKSSSNSSSTIAWVGNVSSISFVTSSLCYFLLRWNETLLALVFNDTIE